MEAMARVVDVIMVVIVEILVVEAGIEMVEIDIVMIAGAVMNMMIVGVGIITMIVVGDVRNVEGILGRDVKSKISDLLVSLSRRFQSKIFFGVVGPMSWASKLIGEIS